MQYSLLCGILYYAVFSIMQFFICLIDCSYRMKQTNTYRNARTILFSPVRPDIISICTETIERTQNYGAFTFLMKYTPISHNTF